MRCALLVLAIAGGCRAVRPPPGDDTAGLDDTGATDTGAPESDSDTGTPEDTQDSPPDTAGDSDTAVDTGPDWVTPDATVGWDAKLVSGAVWQWAISLAGGTDLSGDGVDDLAVGGYSATGMDPGTGGQAFIFDGGSRESGVALKEDAADRAVGPVEVAPALAWEVASGDVDGDGFPDFVLSDPGYYQWDTHAYAGAVFVFHGPIVGTVGDEAVVATLTTSCPEDPWSYSYCSIGETLDVGDANGDAYADIAVDGIIGEGAYTAAIVAGPVVGDVDLLTDSLVLFTDGEAAWFIGDADGDGAEDALLCGGEDGSLLSGPLSGTYEAADAVAGFTDASCLGKKPAVRDLDGDGYPDFAVARAGQETDRGEYAGKVYLMYGPLVGFHPAETLGGTLQGFAGQALGTGLAVLGDLDGKGYPELVLGSPEYGNPWQDDPGPGAAYLFYGPLGGVLGPEDADQVLAEHDGNDAFGDQVVNVGDLDADGLDDLAITGPEEHDAGGYGAVWLYYGASLVP